MSKLFMSGNAMLADVWLCCSIIGQTFLPEPLANILGLHWIATKEASRRPCAVGIHNVYEQRQILANIQYVHTRI